VFQKKNWIRQRNIATKYLSKSVIIRSFRKEDQLKSFPTIN